MHEGHRQRMYAKIAHGENLYDHEVLECLLFSAYPRVNTNPIAHELLDRFGSIYEIINADVEELKSVKGVGNNVAYFLKTINLCFERITNTECVAILKNFGDCKKFVEMRFKGMAEENLQLYFLDKAYKVKRVFNYTSFNRNRVDVKVDEIIKNISVAKPHSIMVAHNHLNNLVDPSEKDDDFTGQLAVICNLNNVVLLDHVIYSNGEFYSYKDSGRLEEIKSSYSMRNFLKWTKNLT